MCFVNDFFLGTVVSIAFFNFAGVSVTKELSATTRMVLDSVRTLVIWTVSLSLHWQNFYWPQVRIEYLLRYNKFKIFFSTFTDYWVRLTSFGYGSLQQHYKCYDLQVPSRIGFRASSWGIWWAIYQRQWRRGKTECNSLTFYLKIVLFFSCYIIAYLRRLNFKQR